MSDFYDGYIFDKKRSGYPERIWNSQTNTVERDAEKVLEIFHKEASSILSNETPKPESEFLPPWFDTMYAYNSKELDLSIWEPLLKRFTVLDILEAIDRDDTAPGMDGLTKGVLKVAFSQKYRNFTRINFTLEFITKLLNVWYTSGSTPTNAAEGMIVPTPKKGKVFSKQYCDKRPLTMTNCIPKIGMSILSTKFKRILSENNILSNFAYVKGSSIDDCHTTFITAIEESFLDREPLFSMAYDQSKAFDRIQFWHLELTFKRFGLPGKFCAFVMSYLRNSISYVRTGHGLTSPIFLKNSVRQGDPLAPYLYICCIDGLADLLEEKLSLKINIKESQFFYADDIEIFSRELRTIREAHVLIDKFFQAHTLVLNEDKTVARIFNGCSELLETLSPLKLNKTEIYFSLDKPFRYLGLTYGKSLDWSPHVQKILNSKLMHLYCKLKNENFTLKQCVFIYRDHVVSAVDSISKYIFIPTNILRYWDSLFYTALCSNMVNPYSKVSKAGLYSILNILPLASMSRISTVSEKLLTLNKSSDASLIARENASRYRLLNGSLVSLKLDKTSMSQLLRYCMKNDFEIFFNYQSSDLRKEPRSILTHMCDDFPVDSEFFNQKGYYEVFTYGSSKPGSSISGTSALIVQPREVDLGSFNNAICCSLRVNTRGNNYIAEGLAIVSCLTIAPPLIPLVIHTDSMSSMQEIIGNSSKTERQRIRSKYRFLSRHLQEMLLRREAPVFFKHVKSHTARKEFRFVGNDIADRECNYARKSGEILEPNFLASECQYILKVEGHLVIEDYRTYLKNYFSQKLIDDWTEKKHQGQHAKECHDMKSCLKGIPKKMKFSQLCVASLTRTVPTARILKHLNPKIFSNYCPFCTSWVRDDEFHFYECLGCVSSSLSLDIDKTELTENDVFLKFISQVLKMPDDFQYGIEVFEHLRNLFLINERNHARFLDRNSFLAEIEHLNCALFLSHAELDLNLVSTLVKIFEISTGMVSDPAALQLDFQFWNCKNLELSQCFGYFTGLEDLKGKNTLVTYTVDEDMFHKLQESVWQNLGNYPPTRIIFHCLHDNLIFKNLRKLPTLEHQEGTFYCYQNVAASVFFPLNATAFHALFGCHPKMAKNTTFQIFNCFQRVNMLVKRSKLAEFPELGLSAILPEYFKTRCFGNFALFCPTSSIALRLSGYLDPEEKCFFYNIGLKKHTRKVQLLGLFTILSPTYTCVCYQWGKLLQKLSF